MGGLILLLYGRDGGVIPANEMELMWVKQVWKENQQLWIDPVLSWRYHYYIWVRHDEWAVINSRPAQRKC